MFGGICSNILGILNMMFFWQVFISHRIKVKDDLVIADLLQSSLTPASILASFHHTIRLKYLFLINLQ
jgi:hypothetical protein